MHAQTLTHPSRLQKAIGLLELMLSLAVISVLLVIGIRYYQSVKYQQQLTITATLVKDIISASSSWGAAYPDYQKLSLQTLIDVNLIPTTYTKNPWGGDVDVRQADGDPHHIKIILADIPEDRRNQICSTLSAQFSDYTIVCP